MRSISSRRAATGREIWTSTMKIMFVTLFTVQLFSYFGALIFPLSCSAGSRSSLPLPAAATSLLSFREEFLRPKYLPIESTEHLEFIENHFYFIKPMIDTEVFIFATTEGAEYPFYGSNNLFSHWHFCFYAARFVRLFHFLLPVKKHILKFILESHVIPIKVWPPPRRHLFPISFGWTSKMAFIFPEPVRNFYFFVSLIIRIKAILQYSAMTLFYMSSREDSRTQLMCVLPHALVT